MPYARIAWPVSLIMMVLVHAVPATSLGEGMRIAEYNQSEEPWAERQYPYGDVNGDLSEACEYDYGYLDDPVAWKSIDVDSTAVPCAEQGSSRPASPMVDYYNNPIPGTLADSVDEQQASAEERQAIFGEVHAGADEWSFDDFMYGDAYEDDGHGQDGYLEEVYACKQIHAFDAVVRPCESEVDSDTLSTCTNRGVIEFLEQTVELGRRFERHVNKSVLHLAQEVSPVVMVIALHRLVDQANSNSPLESIDISTAWSDEHIQPFVDYDDIPPESGCLLVSESWFVDLVNAGSFGQDELNGDALSEAMQGVTKMLFGDSLFREMVRSWEHSRCDHICGMIQAPL